MSNFTGQVLRIKVSFQFHCDYELHEIFALLI